MNTFIESIRMALATLSSNKLRSTLTTMGIVIGISTVLMMGWLLSGFNTALHSTLDIFGEDVLYVDKWDWTGQDWMSARNRKPITYDQFVRVKQRLALPEDVVPTSNHSAQKVQFGDLILNTVDMLGSEADYSHIIGDALASGRFFNATEDLASAPVAVLGPQIVENLFPGGDAIGKVIRIEGLPFTVVGIMPKRGALGLDFMDRQIIIPIKRFFSMFPTVRGVTICVKAGGKEKLEDVRYETIGVMRQVRSLSPGTKDDFAVNEQQSFRAQIDQLSAVAFTIGLTMTGLSFLVGSIGIMNIMFVSVTERTREIGIRKALGATRRSILIQFLIESVMLCMVGAVIAFVFTSLLAYFGVSLARDNWGITFLSRTLPASQIVVAVVVSVAVGILAGIIPAFRGARLDPVDALRSE